jgi:hypothetical protein
MDLVRQELLKMMSDEVSRLEQGAMLWFMRTLNPVAACL